MFEHPEVVVTIDFGTSRSAISYCIVNTGKRLNICHWPNTEGNPTKVASAILYEKDADNNFKAVAFSEDAIKKSVTQQSTPNLVLVHGFKMRLKEQKEQGVSIQQALSDYLSWLKGVYKETTDLQISGAKTRWCLTCPAIWTENEKQIMVQAAKLARLTTTEDPIGTRELVIVLEPEGAAADFLEFAKNKELEWKNKIVMVVDGGAGTMDLTVHQFSVDGRAHEIVHGDGNRFGGNSVNQQFWEALSKQFQKDSISTFTKVKPNLAFRIQNDFEKKKRDVNVSKEKSTFVTLVTSLQQTVNPNPQKGWNFDWEDEPPRVNINMDIWKGFFDQSLGETRKLIFEMFSLLNVNDIKLDYIYLVGGYSASPFLQQAIKDAAATKKPNPVICIPEVPEAAIVSGALTLGLNPQWIGRRVTRFTYGLQIMERFDPKKHGNRQPWKDPKTNESWCENVFLVLARKGQQYTFNDVVTKPVAPPSENHLLIRMAFYQISEENPPYFTDHQKFQLCGEIIINLPKLQIGKNDICLKAFFGRPTIEVEAYNESTKECYKTTLDPKTKKAKLMHHIIFVIDRSGSMIDGDLLPTQFEFDFTHNNRLGAVFQACEVFIRKHLPPVTSKKISNELPGMVYSLVQFSSAASIVFKHNPLGKGKLAELVEDIKPEGGTNYHKAFECILENQLLTYEEYSPVIVFLSDGEDDGNGRFKAHLDKALALHPNLIVHSILVGTDKGMGVLMEMAEKGKGVFTRCTDLNTLLHAFEVVAVQIK